MARAELAVVKVLLESHPSRGGMQEKEPAAARMRLP
jgi:hypothetical protein